MYFTASNGQTTGPGSSAWPIPSRNVEYYKLCIVSDILLTVSNVTNSFCNRTNLVCSVTIWMSTAASWTDTCWKSAVELVTNGDVYV